MQEGRRDAAGPRTAPDLSGGTDHDGRAGMGVPTDNAEHSDVNNERKSRFEVAVEGDGEGEGEVAVADYRRRGGRVEFTHTVVPGSARGGGVGKRLAQEALDWARAEGLEVVATCPFMRSYIERHAEYQDLLATK